MLIELINELTAAITQRTLGLEQALFRLQEWIEQRGSTLTTAEREAFSQWLQAEQQLEQRNGQSYGDNSTLIGSILRLHATRLLRRYDWQRLPPLVPKDNSPYEVSKQRFMASLQQVEHTVKEAQVDAAIANVHFILDDPRANRRWLYDALARLQSLAGKDLLGLAQTVNIPEAQPVTWWNRLFLWLSGMRMEKLSSRLMETLRQLASMQATQFTEVANLLIDMFTSVHDQDGVRQAQALLKAPPALPSTVQPYQASEEDSLGTL